MFPFKKKTLLKPGEVVPAGQKKPKSKWRYLLWVFLLAIVGLLAWLSVTGFITLNKITSTNNGTIASFFKFAGNILPGDIKAEGDSRINILVTGMGDPGHPGDGLTDTMQVISIDPINNKIAMLSIPRDLYVTQANGVQTKINAVNAEAQSNYCKVDSCPSGTDQGGDAMKAIVDQVTGVQINYFVRLDFTGFVNIVNTLGGIDVNVPKTLIDPYYPNGDANADGPVCYTGGKCRYMTLDIAAGEHHFDGETALEYARSRDTTSDFDRSKRQQLIMAAIAKKADTLGFLSNPSKITSVLNAIGNNLKTDIPTSEFSQMVSLIKKSGFDNATVATLDTSSGSPLTAVNGPVYKIYPKLGINDYTDVHTFVSKVFLDPYVVKEQAKVALVNATGSISEGTTIDTLLTGLGYNVISTTSSATQSTSTVTSSSSKPFTVSLLKQRFSANVISNTDNMLGADITLTVGKNYLSN